jgi:hypothetical protein
MLQVANFLKVYFGHNALAIEVIIAVMLSTVLVWLFTNLGRETKEENNLKDIEAALKRVLQTTSTPMQTASQATGLIKDDDDKPVNVNLVTSMAPGATPTKPVPMPIGGGAPAITPIVPLGSAAAATTPIVPLGSTPAPAAPVANTEELNKLKAEAEARAKKLAELENSLKAANDELAKAKAAAETAAATASSVGAPSVDVTGLNKKITDLEARLAEYEIIEDDIANLSLYKEENTRLKNELDKLKKGGGTQATESAPAAPTPVAKSPEPAPAPAAPVAKATPAAAAAPAETPAPAAPGAPASQVDADKLLAEFNAMAANPEKAAPAAPGETKDTGEKLIAEFENFMKGTGG